MTYTTEELRNQAVAQCNVVVHLATAIARKGRAPLWHYSPPAKQKEQGK